jgi:hypothetical protein
MTIAYHGDIELFIPVWVKGLFLDLRTIYFLVIECKDGKRIRFATPVSSQNVFAIDQLDSKDTLVYDKKLGYENEMLQPVQTHC